MFSNLSMLRFFPRGRERGALMLELIIALGLASIMAMGMIRLSEEQDRRTQANVMARQAITIGDAVQRYVNDRYATLLTTATPTQAVLVRIPELVSAGYLPAGTSASNWSRQTLCALVLEVATPPPSGSPPGTLGPARLQALLVSEGGTAVMDDAVLSRVAIGIGAAGGAIYQNLVGITGTISGVAGGWSIPLASSAYGLPNDQGQRCDGSSGPVQLTPGHYMMALWYGKTFSNEDVIYAKEIPGRPDLNTMKTEFGLYVDGVGVKNVRFGEACAQSGHLAADAAGQMLTCKPNSGVLRWGNFYSIDRTGAVAFGKSCNMEGASAADGTGVPLVCKGGVWGSFYATSTGVVAGGACAAAMNGAYAVDAAGSPLICKAGFWTFSFPTSAAAVADGACTPDGSMVAGSDGSPYICVNGKWKLFSDQGTPQQHDFTAPGAYYFMVPTGVTEISVTMAGGGESGGASNARSSSSDAETFPGGSGGFVIDRPVRVIPGQKIDIIVGSGGAPYPAWGMGYPGQLSSVTSTYSLNPINIICRGGGGNPQGHPGWAGSCNVEPYGAVPAPAAMHLNEGHLRGGQTPFRYGSGGVSGRCWVPIDPVPDDCANMDGGMSHVADYRNNVNPPSQPPPWGMNGAVFLRWRTK